MKKMADRILVPMDGSDAALQALEQAGYRKRHAAGEVTILVLNVQARLPPSRYVTRTMIKDYHAHAAARALRPARAAARRLELDARFYARQGDPATTIDRFAKKLKCSEIIMGTRGQGRMASFVLGSVALRVIQLSRVPVTLVK